MNLFLGKNSVIIIDNAKIHHDKALVKSVEKINRKVIYLPSYSSDYNFIEIAFSSLKAWFKKYRDFIKNYNDSEYIILYALSQTTSDMVRNYFAESIYV